MGMYNYRFSSKKRRAIMGEETIDLHLYVWHFRGHSSNYYWDKRAMARIDRGYELSEAALKKSTSKLCVRSDDWKSVEDGMPVYLISEKYAYCDAEEKPCGKVVGFVKRVGNRIHIVKNIGWKNTGVTGMVAAGEHAGRTYEVEYRWSFDEKGPYEEVRDTYDNGETKTQRHYFGS